MKHIGFFMILCSVAWMSAFAGTRTLAAAVRTAAMHLEDSLGTDAAGGPLAAGADTVLAAGSGAQGRKLNAMDYSMMKRWRPEDEVSFTSGRFLDNTFVSLSGGGYRIFDDDYSSGQNLMLYFGKWLNPYHALRLSAGTGYFFDNFDKYRIKHIDARLSYMFNFSSYIGGYRPSRFCGISGVAGLGYSYLWRRGGYSGHALTAHLGMDFNMHVLKNMDIFVEPLFELMSDGLSVPRVNNWRRYFGSFSGSVGLSWRFDPDGFPDIVPDGRMFVTLSGGIQMQNSAIVRHDIDPGKVAGMAVAAGVGRRYGNSFAMRLTAAYSRNNWMQTLAGDCLATDYIALRLEGMLGVVSLVNGREHNLFCASLLLGPEIGYMVKHDIGGGIVVPSPALKLGVPYVGMTGGVQAKFRISHRVALFIEPRFAVIPYSAPSDDLTSPNANRNYYDGLMNCSAGVEYYL